MNPEAKKVVNGTAETPLNAPPQAKESTTPTATTAPAPEEKKAAPALTPEQKQKILDAARAAGKAAAEKVKAARDELAQIIGKGREYEAATGNKIKIPPMDGLREKRAVLIVLDFLSRNESLLSEFSGEDSITGGQIVKTLLANIGAVYDDVAALVSCLTDIPQEEVMKLMVFGDLLEVISPFLALQATTMQSAISMFLPAVMNIRGKRVSGTRGAFGNAHLN